ncbi:MAG: ATP-binding protein [Verrucomicrobia bacterium]|nr:ATP-binding protein [Verrucomicrobiota bacterium]
MSFDLEKKREEAQLAEKAMEEKDWARAAFHLARAADFALNLYEKTEGKIRRTYLTEARGLLSSAEKLKQKAVATNAQIEGGLDDTNLDEQVSSSVWLIKEKPVEKLADVAGLDEVKQVLIEQVIEPFQTPELFERFKIEKGAGVLMYGPPGNGKTFIARAIAGELDAAFFPVDSAQIKDKYVGETEKNLKRLFEEAMKYPRAVIFLDEVDNLLARRGNRKIGAVAQFLSLTDGLLRVKNCLLLLASTNKPWLLDPALLRPGRLGTHIYVGLPDAKAREAIITGALKGAPVAPDVSIPDLAAQTEGYSGADLAKSVCLEAKQSAKRRQKATGKDEFITREDFTQALAKIKPSIKPQDLKDFEKWRENRAHPSADSDTDE